MHDIQKLKFTAHKLLMCTFGVHCVSFLQSIVNKGCDTDGIIIVFSSCVKE